MRYLFLIIISLSFPIYAGGKDVPTQEQLARQNQHTAANWQQKSFFEKLRTSGVDCRLALPIVAIHGAYVAAIYVIYNSTGAAN